VKVGPDEINLLMSLAIFSSRKPPAARIGCKRPLVAGWLIIPDKVDDAHNA
jgi:hypothetical protein